MNIKQSVIFDDHAEQKILEGCELVARAVGSTMGPGGKYVMNDEFNLYPRVTKDGVSVARMLYFLEDKYARMAAQVMVNAADKQVNESGDGTTCTIVLAYEILKLGMKAIRDGANPADVRDGIRSGMEKVLKILKERSRSVVGEIGGCNEMDMRHVATIACNGNKEIANYIVDAIIAVGKHGIVDHEKSSNGKHSLEIKNGYQWDKGMTAPHFCTDREKMKVEFKDARVLVTDQPIQWVRQLQPMFKKLEEAGMLQVPLVIIGRVSGEALGMLANNAANGKLKVVVAEAPGDYEDKKLYTGDIATLTGATVVTEEKNMRMEKFELGYLGECGKFISSLKHSVIVEGKGDTKETVASIENHLTESDIGDPERELSKTRLAKLTGGVAVIKVGGKTETEQSEIDDRVDDAVRATLAAKEEGIVEGGGYALARAASICNWDNSCTKEEMVLMNSCSVPFHKIMENASCDITGFFGKENSGYDAKERRNRVDLFVAGIIDPLKVIRTALENAVSVATMLLCTKTLIITEKSDDQFKKEMVS